MNTIKVVGAVITDAENRILAAQRAFSENPYKSFKWEFPGGKIEENESPEDALKREIKEELDCEIKVGEKIGEIRHEYPDFNVELYLYFCKLSGNSLPSPLEHNRIRWVGAEDLESLDWIEADYEILPLIKKRLISLTSSNV